MFFVQVGTLVAMGKVKVESFCSVSFEIFDFFFSQICLLGSPSCPYDFCQNRLI